MRTFSVKNFERFQHYKDRAPPWIKLYNELLDDYEFGALPDASKMHLIAIWLLASRSENKIPYDPAWVGRRINANSKVDLDLLVKSGFLIEDQEVHNAEQVASKPLAECKQDACLETEGEKRRVETEKRICASDFDLFWKEYPRRDGANPKDPARKQFEIAVKSGVPPAVLIAAAKRCAYIEHKNVGTPYIPQAIKWLRDKRWNDYPPILETVEIAAQIEVMDERQLAAWDDYGKRTNGKPYPRNKRGGWVFPSKWPPGFEEQIADGVRELIRSGATL